MDARLRLASGCRVIVASDTRAASHLQPPTPMSRFRCAAHGLLRYSDEQLNTCNQLLTAKTHRRASRRAGGFRMNRTTSAMRRTVVPTRVFCAALVCMTLESASAQSLSRDSTLSDTTGEPAPLQTTPGTTPCSTMTVLDYSTGVSNPEQLLGHTANSAVLGSGAYVTVQFDPPLKDHWGKDLTVEFDLQWSNTIKVEVSTDSSCGAFQDAIVCAPYGCAGVPDGGCFRDAELPGWNPFWSPDFYCVKVTNNGQQNVGIDALAQRNCSASAALSKKQVQAGESDDLCELPPGVPAVSPWSAAVTTLLMLSVGTLIFRSRVARQRARAKRGRVGCLPAESRGV